MGRRVLGALCIGAVMLLPSGGALADVHAGLPLASPQHAGLTPLAPAPAPAPAARQKEVSTKIGGSPGAMAPPWSDHALADRNGRLSTRFERSGPVVSVLRQGVSIGASGVDLAGDLRSAVSPDPTQSAPFAAGSIVKARSGVARVTTGLSGTFGVVAPSAGAGQAVSFVVAGVGRGADLVRPKGAIPVVRGSSVTYARGALTEWYREDSAGLEQGFTLRRRPSGSGRAWMTVAVRAVGGPRPAMRGKRIVFDSPSGGLDYSGLSASDAKGRPLPSRLVLRGRTLLLRVADAQAVYPLTIDPMIEPLSELVPADGTEDSQFGAAVAVTADGNTAFVGDPSAAGGVGAVWVFDRSGSTWTEEGKIVPPDAAGASSFGSSIAVAAFNAVYIGGPGDTSG